MFWQLLNKYDVERVMKLYIETVDCEKARIWTSQPLDACG